MLAKGHAVRMLGCYFDFSRVVVVDPIAVDISHSMFLGGTGVEIRSSRAGATISGLVVAHNQFVLGDTLVPGPWEGIYLNTTAGAFGSVNSTDISGNSNPPATYGPQLGASQHLRQTVVRKTLVKSSPAKSWQFDVGQDLVFPVELAPLHVTFSVEATTGFPSTVLRPVRKDGVIIVESVDPFSGAVHIVVRQAGSVGA